MKNITKIIFTAVVLLSSVQMYATDALKLKISGNSYSDEAVIRFISGATDGIDNDYDAFKLFSSNKQVPAIYTVAGLQSPLCTNSFPFLTSGLNVNIHVLNYATSTYSINAYEFGSISSTIGITLEDVKTGTHYNMRNGGTYAFFLTADSVAQQARFVLHFALPVIPNNIDKPVASSVVYCQGDSIAPLMAAGTNIKWYNNATLTNQVAAGNTYNTGKNLQGTYTYYVTQSDNTGSQSPATEVSLVINSLPATPVVNNVQVCESQIAPELTATGTNVKWYTDAQLSNFAGTGNSFAPAVNSTSEFYATQTDLNGCASVPAIATVEIKPALSQPIVTGVTEYCEGDLMNLTAVGQNVTWYTSINLNNKIHSGNVYTPAAEETMVLYVIQSVNNCVSTALPVAVVVNPLPQVAISNISSRYSVNDDKVVLNGIPAGGFFSGPGISGDQFDPAALVNGGPYPVTYEYTNNKGCKNTTTSFITIEELKTTGIASVMNNARLNMFPNPASEQAVLNLELTNKSEVQIEMYDMTGKSVVLQSLMSMEAGNYNFEINKTNFNLSAGVYWVKINMQNEQNVIRVIFQ